MPSLDKHALVHRICLDALLLCVALMLSYLEAILPISLLLPLPGLRMGWANLAITLTFFLVGKRDAAVVSAARVLIMGLLFGSATSLWFSVCGALLSYGGLWFGHLVLRRRYSYIGLGMLCAALHNLGQLLAAALLFGSGVLLTYLPVLLLASITFGGVGGWVLNVALPRIPIPQGGERS